MSSYAECVECYAIPGADSIIDAIDPGTGRTIAFNQTEAEVLAREPFAVRMRISDYAAAKAARQQTPIAWTPSSAEQYHEMLEILPPAAWIGGYFLVGEPYDHCAATGRPRFTCYRVTGTCTFPRYAASSRQIGRAHV